MSIEQLDRTATAAGLLTGISNLPTIERMNVLFLTDNAGRASTTVATRGWFEHLIPRGLRPVLASPAQGEFHEWALENDVPSYRVDLPFPDKRRPWAFAAALWKLRRLVKKHRIQVIHCNEQNIYPIGRYLSRICRIPIVVSVHFTMNRGFCEWAFRGSRQPDRIFFISSGNREACRSGVKGIIEESRWRLLPNGLDLNHFKPDSRLGAEFRREHGLGDGLLIGVGCAFRSRKQLEHLLQAAVLLPQDVRIVLAGGPVPDERKYAEALIREFQNRLDERFKYVGFLTELRGFYNALDLFVNTSQEEACSISVLESLACGCPVVGYPSKSVDGQILPHGGEIVPQDDIEELTAVIRRWVQDRDWLASRRTAARRQVQQFDIKTLSSQLWDEYEELLGIVTVQEAPLV